MDARHICTPSDNYSRKILAWKVSARLGPMANCQLLFAAAKHMVFAGRPLLHADSGIENLTVAVDAAPVSACLERVLAQVDVAYSNSMIDWLLAFPEPVALPQLPRLD